MTGPTVLDAAWVVKNLHVILLARFHARDKLRCAKNESCQPDKERRGRVMPRLEGRWQ
jgi:hypothetical protein